jgi:hypothetical protein
MIKLAQVVPKFQPSTHVYVISARLCVAYHTRPFSEIYLMTLIVTVFGATYNHHFLFQICGIYGGTFHFSHLPSSSWQAACVLFGGGSLTMCVAALLATVTLCVADHSVDRRIALVTGYVQTIAGA